MRKLVLIGAAAAVALVVLIGGVIVLIGLLTNDPAYELIRRADELSISSDTAGETGEEGASALEGIEEAADLYGQVALIAPESPRAPEALFKMGQAYYMLISPRVPEQERGEKRRMAEDAFLQLIERYPDSSLVPAARKQLGEIYMAGATAGGVWDPAEQYEKAVEQYEILVGQTEDAVERQEISFNLAICCERLGKYDMAIRHLTDIINLGAEGMHFESAHLMLARYFSEAGRHDRAVEQLEQLLGHEVSDPTYQDAHIRLVSSLLQLERFEDAEAALGKVEESATNKDLIEDYKDRIRRWSREGG